MNMPPCKELDELVARCKKLIRARVLDALPNGVPIATAYIDEVEINGVRIVLEVPLNSEEPTLFDICKGTTVIYQERCFVVRPDDIGWALAAIRRAMVLDDLADV